MNYNKIEDLEKQKAELEEKLKSCNNPMEYAKYQALINVAKTLIELERRDEHTKQT